MKRWIIRNLLVGVAVAAIPFLWLWWDDLPPFWKWLAPSLLICALIAFALFDLKTPFPKDDPAYEELKKDADEFQSSLEKEK